MYRISFYDVLKGFAIWIVAFEHCFLALDHNAQNTYLSNAIQLIQMPLFMVISGYFFYPSIKKYSFGENLKRKFRHLYVPSLSWGIIGSCAMFVFKIINHKEIDINYFVCSVFTGMWFLTTLFILSTIGAFFYEYLRKYFFRAWIFLFLVLYFIPNTWMVNEVKFLLPFFVLAIFFRNYDWQHVPFWLFVLSVIFWGGTSYVYDWGFTLYTMDQTEILTWEYLYKTIIRIVGGLSGIICILYLFRFIKNIKCLNNLLLYVGGVTLPIYVLHQNFLLIPILLNYSTENKVVIFVMSLLIIGISILCYKILRHKFFRSYLFGEL